MNNVHLALQFACCAQVRYFQGLTNSKEACHARYPGYGDVFLDIVLISHNGDEASHLFILSSLACCL